MKQAILALLLVLFGSVIAYGQQYESVNWTTPVQFSVKEIKFRSDKATMECHNCKCMEIRSDAGLTGYFIIGDGKFSIPSKKIADKFSSCMIRFNVIDPTAFVTIAGKQKINEKQFYTASMGILKTVFPHCYSMGSDAYIPPRGAYALDVQSPKYGDFLISVAGDKSKYHSYTQHKDY